MAALAGDSIFVDPMSLDDFRTYLQARLDEAFSARLALTSAPAADRPAVGNFDDANHTASRLGALRQEYVARLDRLINALTAAQTATALVAQRYRTADDPVAVDPTAVRAAVEPVNEALSTGTARHA